MYGIVASEVAFGTGCHDVTLGSAANPSVFGGASGDIEAVRNYGGTWDVRDLNFQPSACAHYDVGTHGDSQMQTYDDRN